MRSLKPLDIDDKEKNRLINIIDNKNDRYDSSIVTACLIIYYYNYYMDINKIIEELGVCRKTIFNHIKQYREDKYYMFKIKNTTELNKYRNDIRKNFKDNPVRSYREAVIRIESITGVKRSLPQVYNFLSQDDNYYFKNNDGNYTKSGEPNTKRKNTYLYQHLEKIGNYIEQNPSADEEVVINRIKNKFPEIKEEDYEILKALSDYLPF